MDLDLALVRETITRFVKEDVGRGDITTHAVVPEDARGRARIEARSDFVVAGLEVARLCFDEVGHGRIRWEPSVSDGATVSAGDALARLDGSLQVILTGERTALNLLGRLSGIATLTRSFAEAIQGTPARIVDTRKTTPGLRLLEKYAVRVGGGHNHRFGLDDGILVKDNHLRAAGGVAEAVRKARNGAPHGLVVEVEVTTLDELDEALAAGADAILLDNMTPETVREAVTRAGGKALLEASGGMTLESVRAYAEAGVDLISVGALTHSAPSVDVSLEVEA